MKTNYIPLVEKYGFHYVSLATGVHEQTLRAQAKRMNKKAPTKQEFNDLLVQMIKDVEGL